jgi:hypothetical protein
MSILSLAVIQYWQKKITFMAPPALHHANQENFWSDRQYKLNGFQ